MKEQDDKRDEGGNRGSNFGMGKLTHSQGDCSEADIKRGYKDLGKASLKEEGKLRR